MQITELTEHYGTFVGRFAVVALNFSLTVFSLDDNDDVEQWFPNFFSLLPNLTCHIRRATHTKCCQY